MPQFGAPCAVRATSLQDPTVFYSFHSLTAAVVKVNEWTGKTVHHITIKRHAEQNKEAFGYRWELVTAETPPEPLEDPHITADTSTFTFRDCVEAIFNGGRIRVTDETPRRASIFDIICVVMGEKCNPRSTWQRIQESVWGEEMMSKCENKSFSGMGQRPTPVTNSEGIMLLVNILPGDRARQFRASAMQTLVRYLAGDPSLHEELDENARRQAELPERHPMQMIGEEVYAHPRSAKYVFTSPNMRGKYIGDFYNRMVVYLLTFSYEGRDYIKIGWSDAFRKRMDDHYRELPGCKIYCVYSIENANRIEQCWKDDFRAYCAPVVVNGITKTELHYGVNLEEAENRLIDLCREQRASTDGNREFEMMERRMQHELAMKDKELEGMRLQLQILQVQQGVRTAGS